MSRHHRAVWILCLSFCLAVPTRGQDAIPDSLKNGSIGPSERARIEAFITHQLQRLASDDATAQASARDRLVQETTAGGNPAPPMFLDAYADLLGKNLVHLLAPDAPPRQRLLAAIVAAKVADAARNTRLLDVVLLELKDQQMPIVLWGMKAARSVLPPVLNNPLLNQQAQLPQAILDAVERTGSLPIIQEAYAASTVGLFAVPSRSPSVAEIQSAVPLIQDLLRYRLTAYQKGVPQEPAIENNVTLFLSHPNVWPRQTPEQQQRTASELMTLLSYAGQRYPSDPSALTSVIQQTSKAMYIITNDPTLQSALVPLTRLTPQTPAAAVTEDVQAVYKALVSIPQFKDVAEPAQLPAPDTEAATQP